MTGGNTGIGFEVALALAAATVSRSKERVDTAVKKLKAAHSRATVSGYALDISAFRRAAAPWPPGRFGGAAATSVGLGVNGLYTPRAHRGPRRTAASYVLRSRVARAASSIDAFVERLSGDGISALHKCTS